MPVAVEGTSLGPGEPSAPTARAGALPVVGAVDIGGTKTALALVGADGGVLGRVRLATPPRPRPEALADLVAARWRELLAAAAGLPAPAAVGVAVPGPADAAAGVVHRAFDWPWDEVPLAELLAARLGATVRLDNDVNCCCLGEMRFGAARGVPDFAWVQVSTGVGGGLVLGGRLYGGAHGLAGEIGHVVLEEDGPACHCGRRGCLEALVGGPAIARRGHAPARDVFAAAARGDAAALRVVEAVARDLGRGLALLVNLLDPALVVLGGGVMDSLRAWLPRVREALEGHAFAAPGRRVALVYTALEGDAPLLGAAALAHGGP